MSKYNIVSIAINALLKYYISYKSGIDTNSKCLADIFVIENVYHSVKCKNINFHLRNAKVVAAETTKRDIRKPLNACYINEIYGQNHSFFFLEWMFTIHARTQEAVKDDLQHVEICIHYSCRYV